MTGKAKCACVWTCTGEHTWRILCYFFPLLHVTEPILAAVSHEYDEQIINMKLYPEEWRLLGCYAVWLL
jgi:hypothetical protein